MKKNSMSEKSKFDNNVLHAFECDCEECLIKWKLKGNFIPCMCWFDPPEESKKLIKNHCKQIVDEVKRLREMGDPLGCEIKDVHELIDHLYDPSSCKESNTKS